MLRAILVDDEVLALKNLKFVLSQFADIVIEASIANPLEALVKIGGIKPDVVFLDIEMPRINGFVVAEEILKVSAQTLVVFVTAYDEYAVKAFETNAIDYILKPASPERIKHTLEKIRERYSIRKSLEEYQSSIRNASGMLDFKIDKVIAWKNDRIFLFGTEEILYFTLMDGEAVVVTEGDTYKVKGTLNSWEESLKKLGFFRCHKSYLINIDKIAVISPMFKNTFAIRLKNCATEIPVSRRYAVEFKKNFIWG
ncbi:MAG: hypothetical protein VR72_20475 [Clostridiaceae bacterium BRH_c20a]|nr:MAG: hypothetical protein VR72_20475 [Clostridiaceae bacterium BRH_c20a]